MSDKPKTISHHLTAGAIAILKEVLPTPAWYKDEPEQAIVIVDAVGVHESLPDLGPRLKPEKDEQAEAFDARFNTWAVREFDIEWTVSERDAVQKCVKYYLKQGAFAVTKHLRILIKELELGRR
jgi:hypothetical protein